MELEALQANLSEFKKCGASLVALCPQRQSSNEEVSNQLGLDFPVLQDRNNEVATAFGLTLQTPPAVIAAEQFLGLDLPASNETDNWDLPIPSRYVIDHSSVVQYASHHIDHRMRVDPRECLEWLKKVCS